MDDRYDDDRSPIKRNLFEDHNENSCDTNKIKTPTYIFLGRFTNVLEHYPDGTDYLVIQDATINRYCNDKTKTKVEEVSLNSLSVEQLDTIRVMVITPERKRVMDDMGRLLLGSKFKRKQFNYGPGFWYSVLRSYATFKQSYAAEKDISTRFDMLFGFTYCLSKHPRWATQHGRGWGGEKMVAGIAMRWKHLLKYPTIQLGMDEEFSYPALLHFLSDFKTFVESAEMYGDPKLQFNHI
jgi:hypothetical protein